MKGLAVETVLYGIILVFALILLSYVIMTLVPAFGNFMYNSLRGIKESFCRLFGPLGFLLGC